MEQLLEAADALFAEAGYEQATTNAIAARAGAPIGSLYQFFADKEALLHALVGRYREQLHAMHEGMHAESASLSLEQMYDRSLVALAAFHKRNPGFRALFYGSPTSAVLAKAAEVLHDECLARCEAMFAARQPGIDPGRCRLIATINVEVMRALLHKAHAGDEGFRLRMMAEIKTLLFGYTRDALTR
jgi:AcrR family transcriptional regulator